MIKKHTNEKKRENEESKTAKEAKVASIIHSFLYDGKKDKELGNVYLYRFFSMYCISFHSFQHLSQGTLKTENPRREKEYLCTLISRATNGNIPVCCSSSGGDFVLMK